MLADGPRWQLAAMIGQLQSLLDGPVIQARCLECAAIGRAAAGSRDQDKSGFLGRAVRRG